MLLPHTDIAKMIFRQLALVCPASQYTFYNDLASLNREGALAIGDDGQWSVA